MAVVRLADSLRNAMANQITALADAGAGPGTLKVYTGALPADADDAEGAVTLLATFTLTDPSLAAAAAGVADFDPDLSAIVAATGTAAWFRIEDSTGANVIDGDVGTAGAALNFGSVTWTAGGTVNLTTGTATVPASS